MLDSDLASLYGVSTGVLNQAVKRNRKRFPDDFAFILSSIEVKNLKSQFVISSWGGRRKNPYVFTEQGVAMLSSVLKSDRAVSVNVEIMRAFVRLREALSSNKDLSRKVEDLERKYGSHDHQIREIFTALRELMDPPIRSKKKIGFQHE